MNEFVTLLKSYPLLGYIILIILLIAILLISILANRSIKKGIPFKFFNMEIGSKKKPESTISLTQSPTINQNPIINLNFSDTLIGQQDRVQHISERYKELESTKSDILTKNLSPLFNERIGYIYSAPVDIRNRVGKIMFADGGGWAGFSIAPLETYLGYSCQYLDEKLKSEIQDFLFLCDMYKYSDNIPDKDFLQIQYLSADINMTLDQIYKHLESK